MARYAKLGKPDREISPGDLEAALKLNGWMPLEYRAYVVLLYWIGCRRQEPLNLTFEDVRFRDGSVFISHLPASKGGRRAETIQLSLELPGVPLLEELWFNRKKGQKLFTFTGRTGYEACFALLGVYPHWLRYNRVTKIRKKIDRHELSTDDAKSFTGIRSDRTMQTYGLTSNEGAARVSRALE